MCIYHCPSPVGNLLTNRGQTPAGRGGAGGTPATGQAGRWGLGRVVSPGASLPAPAHTTGQGQSAWSGTISGGAGTLSSCGEARLVNPIPATSRGDGGLSTGSRGPSSGTKIWRTKDAEEVPTLNHVYSGGRCSSSRCGRNLPGPWP